MLKAVQGQSSVWGSGGGKSEHYNVPASQPLPSSQKYNNGHNPRSDTIQQTCNYYLDFLSSKTTRLSSTEKEELYELKNTTPHLLHQPQLKQL